MAATSQFSSTPVSVIYAQNWPVPTSNSFSQRYSTKVNSNSQKKSLNNSPWTCKPKDQAKRTQKCPSPAVRKPYSWASSMLSNHYPGWLENDHPGMLDMAKEYKMTLQMFKKLTDQVKEVDEQLNSYKKPYSFKHYFSNKKHSNRHKTNMRTYTPEIPMTNEEYQPCNNLSFKRDQQRPPSHFRTDRKVNKSQNSMSNAKHEICSLPNAEESGIRKWKVQESLTDENYNKKQDNSINTPEFQNENTPENTDNDNISWSGFLEFSGEDNHVGLGYINPVPEDWEVRKLEELELEHCADEDRLQNDPFMLRYLQLCRLETETILQEKGNGCTGNPNSVANLESGVNKVTITDNKDGKKSASSKKQSLKANGTFENLEKNPRRILQKSSTSSLQDLEKYCHDEKGAKKDSCKEISEKKIKQEKVQNSSKRTKCKSAKGKRRVQSCKARPTTYSSSVTYSILELASTFDPPCKERMKLNPRPVTAKSAKSKGMIPGKTWSSQRRFSLTTGQSLQSLPPSDNSDPVVRKSRSSSAKKSSKKTTKRCSSSKF